jgi:hypothetical protein
MPPTVRPISTSRRIASERVASFADAHASTSTMRGGGIRDVTCGSRPVAGRTRLFFDATFIDFMNFFTIFDVTTNQGDEPQQFPPRL